MSSSAPFVRDAGDVVFLGTDRDPPAVVFRLGVFGDRAPGIDPVDVREGVDVFLAKDRGDSKLFLDLARQEVIGNAMLRDGEVREDIA